MEYKYDSFQKRIAKNINGTNTFFIYNIGEETINKVKDAPIIDFSLIGYLINLLSNYDPSIEDIQGENYYFYNDIFRNISSFIYQLKRSQIRMTVDFVVTEYDNNLKLKAKYVMNPTTIDDPIIEKISNENYYYFKNAIGSATSLLSEIPIRKNNYRYYAFGENKLKIEKIVNSYQYTSREYGKENDLYYYRSRIYNQYNGRFIQKDKAMQEINWYIYARNNPNIYNDPYGEGLYEYYLAIKVAAAYSDAVRWSEEARKRFSSDKVQHQWVSEQITRKYGPDTGAVYGLAKEAKDLFGAGTPSFEDLWDDLIGIWRGMTYPICY